MLRKLECSEGHECGNRRCHKRCGERVFKNIVRGFSLVWQYSEGSHYRGGGEALGLPRFARDDKGKSYARFIFAGCDTGANGVLNDDVVLDGLIYAPVIFAWLRRSGLCR